MAFQSTIFFFFYRGNIDQCNKQQVRYILYTLLHCFDEAHLSKKQLKSIMNGQDWNITTLDSDRSITCMYKLSYNVCQHLLRSIIIYLIVSVRFYTK